MHPNRVVHNPIVILFFTTATAFFSSISLHVGSDFSWVLFGLFINLLMCKFKKCVQLYTRFQLKRIDIRAAANIHKTRSRACTFSNNICTVVEEWTHGYFCQGYFSSSTHFNLVLARKVCRQCVLVFAHDLWASWRKLHLSPRENWPFSFHWYTFLPSTPKNPFRLFTTDQIQFSLCLTSMFRTVLSLSDFRVLNLCRLPRFHRMEFLSSITDLRPIVPSNS